MPRARSTSSADGGQEWLKSARAASHDAAASRAKGLRTLGTQRPNERTKGGPLAAKVLLKTGVLGNHHSLGPIGIFALAAPEGAEQVHKHHDPELGAKGVHVAKVAEGGRAVNLDAAGAGIR